MTGTVATSATVTPPRLAIFPFDAARPASDPPSTFLTDGIERPPRIFPVTPVGRAYSATRSEPVPAARVAAGRPMSRKIRCKIFIVRFAAFATSDVFARAAAAYSSVPLRRGCARAAARMDASRTGRRSASGSDLWERRLCSWPSCAARSRSRAKPPASTASGNPMARLVSG